MLAYAHLASYIDAIRQGGSETGFRFHGVGFCLLKVSALPLGLP